MVLPTEIPDKGRVLTGLSGFWFARTTRDRPEPSAPDPRGRTSTECRRLEMLPIECVVRGYLSGSGWKDYRATGEVCGIALPEGLLESERLPEPIFTPTTKAAEGHDEPLTAEQAAGLVGDERFAELERISIELYRRAEFAAGKGIIIADTKFELGLDEQGNVVLGDEAFTPDSSRFWPADEYEPGGPQPSYDKQFVRDYAESLGWDKTPPGPELPDEVVTGHARPRHREARRPDRADARPRAAARRVKELINMERRTKLQIVAGGSQLRPRGRARRRRRARGGRAPLGR